MPLDRLSGSENIVTTTINSGAGAGDQTCTISFGRGLYIITSLSVHSGLTTDRAQGVHIGVKDLQPDGTFRENFVGSGWFSPNKPFILHNVEFEGPADIVSYVFHLSSTSHNLAVSYRRVK